MAIEAYRIKAGQVSMELSSDLRAVGFEAWSQAFDKTRSTREILKMFPVNAKPDAIDREKSELFARFAKHGALVVAFTYPEGLPVGYAMAREDVSGNPAERALKRLLQPEKVYAWLAQINVVPEYQNQGVGRKLLQQTLAAFRPEQIPTAYIFDENPLVWGAAQRLGFSLSPPEQEPRIMYDYFGEDANPVAQYRFAASSVRTVLHNIDKSS